MKIDEAIDRINKRIEEILAGSSVPMTELYAHSGLNEGKRLRAKLFLAFAGNGSGRVIDVGCSIELLHAATLIHDDILDNSHSRRGRPALYLEKGISGSVLYGDYLFSEAFKLTSALKDPVINHEMISALSEVLKGEILEQNSKGDLSLTKQEYFSIIGMKSGCLFGVSARLGALMREDGQIGTDISYLFGLNAGIMFQLIDDYMDYFTERDNKKRFNDIREGLATLPLIYLMERCSRSEKNMITSIFGRNNIDGKSLRIIIQLMREYDVAQSILDNVNDYMQKTERVFSEITQCGICDVFDILSWIKKWRNNASKEYCNSRRRVCRSQRSKTAE